jgi:hypothetical protein
MNARNYVKSDLTTLDSNESVYQKNSRDSWRYQRGRLTPSASKSRREAFISTKKLDLYVSVIASRHCIRLDYLDSTSYHPDQADRGS